MFSKFAEPASERKAKDAASPTFDSIPRKHKRIYVTPSPDAKRLKDNVVVRFQDLKTKDFSMDMRNAEPFKVEDNFYLRVDNILYKLYVEADSERCFACFWLLLASLILLVIFCVILILFTTTDALILKQKHRCLMFSRAADL